MNPAESAYLDLLRTILATGDQKLDRTGTGTMGLFGPQLRFDLNVGFPLLTTKKLNWKAIVVELLWFIRGDTNIRFLLDHGVHIWDEWSLAYQRGGKAEVQRVYEATKGEVSV